MAVVNDSGWQRRSDDWVQMLDQSRLRKERRLKDLAETAEIELGKRVAAGWNKSGTNRKL
jgi:hypothetical protein